MSDSLGKRRDFKSRGVIINLLRALHLVGVVGIGAAVLSILPPAETAIYAGLLIASGVGIAALDRWADPTYFSQINAQSVVFKVVLLGALAGFGSIGTGLFWAVLIGSVLMSHAPRRLRHRKLF